MIPIRRRKKLDSQESEKAIREARAAKNRADERAKELDPLFRRIEGHAKRNRIYESILSTFRINDASKS